MNIHPSLRHARCQIRMTTNWKKKLQRWRNILRPAKQEFLSDAKLILGDHFDPADKKARDDLEASVAPALSQLSEISKLPSMARLGALSKLSEEELKHSGDTLTNITSEASAFNELTKNPAIGSRKQLYARVSAWMKENSHPVEAPCAVCGAPLDFASDPETHQPVRDELQEAFESNTELLSHTTLSWAQSRLGHLAKTLPEALANELRRDLPPAPIDLIKTALDAELFDTVPFQGTLRVLREETQDLAASTLGSLPPSQGLRMSHYRQTLQTSLMTWPSRSGVISVAIHFARWQREHRDAANDAVLKTLTKKRQSGDALRGNSPLGVKLVALSDVVRTRHPLTARSLTASAWRRP